MVKIIGVFLSLIFLIAGCARGSDPVVVEKNYLEVTLQVKGNIDNTTTYIIIFDADSDSSNGPFLDSENRWAGTWTHYVKIENKIFTFHTRISNTDTAIREPLSAGEIKNNILNFLIPLEKLKYPERSVDVNFFVYKGNYVDTLDTYRSFILTGVNQLNIEDPEEDGFEESMDVVLLTIKERKI